MPFYELSCVITDDLRAADALLARYAAWATSDRRKAATCGSAERAFRAPGALAGDARRVPVVSVAISQADRELVQQCLVGMGPSERHVVAALYLKPHRAGPTLKAAGIQFADAAMLHRRALQHVAGRLGVPAR